MVRSLFLATLIVASAALAAAGGSSSSSAMTLAHLRKRDDNGGGSETDTPPVQSAAEKDFADRILIQFQGDATVIDQTASIATSLQMGLSFFGMLDKAHVSGTDDQSSYVIRNHSDVNTWGDGAYGQVNSCVRTAKATVMEAMATCPKETCESDFVIESLFGTSAGMDWAKDGLLLYHCFAFQTDKANCADTQKPGCVFTVLGEFHESMLNLSDGTTDIIGSGATSISQMAQQIDAYNQEHGTTLSPPNDVSRKRSKMRRMVDKGGELESS